MFIFSNPKQCLRRYTTLSTLAPEMKLCMTANIPIFLRLLYKIPDIQGFCGFPYDTFLPVLS